MIIPDLWFIICLFRIVYKRRFLLCGGICLDSKAWENGLYQAVVQYKIDNRKALIISPKASYELDIREIQELPASPRFVYGEQVSPCNHPDMTGVIIGIRWHYISNFNQWEHFSKKGVYYCGV